MLALGGPLAYDDAMTSAVESNPPGPDPDPFTTPRVDEGAGAAGSVALGSTFRAPRKAVVVALWVFVVASVGSVGGLLNQVRVINAAAPIFEALQLSDVITQSTGLFTQVSLWVTFPLWSMWIYRAAANLRAMRSDDVFEFTPASQIWWYVVPLACFIVPLRATREVLVTSYLAADRSFRSIELLSAWWGLWLVSRLLASLTAVFTPSPIWHRGEAYFDRLTLASAVLIVGQLAGIAAAVLGVKLITSINGLQTEWRSRHLSL